jgi:LysM repeat protein
MARALPAIIGGLLIVGASAAQAQTLKGSPTSMQRQNAAARKNDYSFLRTVRDVSKFADLGLLVPVKGNAHYLLAGVSQPYARPAVKTFVERLAAQYMDACGEKLVVTSLTRPLTRQPSNASELSVHPAGMAVDLRIPSTRACRSWLENTLLYLEEQGSLDATRERWPAHYHVAIFPDHYLRYVRSIDSNAGTATLASAATTTENRAKGSSPAEATEQYVVGSGDSLWSIARRFRTSVAELQALNGLKGSTIRAGQKLTVPSAPVTTASVTED